MERMEKPIMVIGTSAPRRREIAQRHFGAAYDLVYLSPAIDEKQIRDSDPFALTSAIAQAKMEELRAKVARDTALAHRIAHRPGSVAVTFDQVVDYHGEIREKPESQEQAVAFIKSYSNDNLATVMTTVLYDFGTGKQASMPNTTLTFYGEISDETVAHVVERGTCLHTAGGFVVEDADMKRCEVKIDPGTEEEVCGFCENSVRALLADVQRS
ncbi:Maf-like_protein [Leishmania braziliensis MHOM/BR/75/M2904]|nr:Maf-like_protein [Leishmania braziliensis MHOM/BR/75/M2904]